MRGAQNKAQFPHPRVVFEGYLDLVKVDNIIAQTHEETVWLHVAEGEVAVGAGRLLLVVQLR